MMLNIITVEVSEVGFNSYDHINSTTIQCVP